MSTTYFISFITEKIVGEKYKFKIILNICDINRGFMYKDSTWIKKYHRMISVAISL